MSVLQASSLQYEMLLLTDSISKEDSCWELRLRCGELKQLKVKASIKYCAQIHALCLQELKIGVLRNRNMEVLKKKKLDVFHSWLHENMIALLEDMRCLFQALLRCFTELWRGPMCRSWWHEHVSLSALSLFLMAVNIKTPVVVENITLMCLRILQKLIKPPAPTSKKNKVLP